MDLHQIPADDVRPIAPYGLKTVALLERGVLETFQAAGITFDPEPDLFGHGGRAWAAVESDTGTRYVLVEHPALDGRVEVRAPANGVSAVELVTRLCEDAGIAREQVLAVASETGGQSPTPGGRSRASALSGFFSRVRDPSSWGYQRVLTGGPRKWISVKAMERMPTGHHYYGPLASEGQPPARRRPRRRPSVRIDKRD
jgi:hypothetical protein